MKSEHYKLKQLLNLYYSGLTTPDDERRLIEMFDAIDELPADMIADRDIVTALHDDVAIDVPDAAADNISLFIDKLARQERRAAAGRKFFAYGGVAASLAIVVSLILFIVKSSTPNPNEITAPQTAYNETARAILMVSESLNKTGAFMNEANHILSKITFIDDSLFEEDDELYDDSIYNELNDGKF